MKLVKTTLTKDEYKLAQKRASTRLDKIMPRRRLIRGSENMPRQIKYQELLKEETERIKGDKWKKS